jgi:hypothetical protein
MLILLAIVQSLNLVVSFGFITWLDWESSPFVSSSLSIGARPRNQCLKQESPLLGVSVKHLDRVALRVDLRETRDRDPMEEAEVSRVLVENVSGQDRQTCNSQRTHPFHPPDILGPS